MARILIVDDEPDVLHLLRLILESARFDVVLATDGTQALARVAELAPDLVLCDVIMPKPDGLDVLAAIRTNPHTHTLPVLMLSAQVQAQHVQRALEAGANGYIVKPFQVRQLLHEITRCLQTQSPRS